MLHLSNDFVFSLTLRRQNYGRCIIVLKETTQDKFQIQNSKFQMHLYTDCV
jgi:hypothetical protein